MKTKAASNWLKRTCVPLLFLLAVGGCGRQQHQTWTNTKDGFVLAVRTSPEPLVAGKNAVISAVLHYQNKPQLADCPIRFRQYPRGHQPTADGKYYQMHQALTSGIYQGESGVFTTPQVWIVDFEIKCQNQTLTMQFPFNVKLAQ